MTKPLKNSTPKKKKSPRTTNVGSPNIGRFFINGKPYLHVSFMRNGKIFQKTFYEHLLGGKQQTLLIAQEWRDQMFILHPIYNTPLQVATHLCKDNTSVRTGVFLRKTVRVKNGKTQRYLFWQAQTPSGTKPFQSKSFTILKYGNDLAYSMAVAAREGFENALK